MYLTPKTTSCAVDNITQLFRKILAFLQYTELSNSTTTGLQHDLFGFTSDMQLVFSVKSESQNVLPHVFYILFFALQEHKPLR